MVNRKLLLAVAFICMVNSLSGQPGACKKDYEQGISQYKSEEYTAAIKKFNIAKGCPDCDATCKKMCDDYVKKCVEKTNARKKNQDRDANNSNPYSGNSSSGSAQTPKRPHQGTGIRPTSNESQVEILYSGYISANCRDGVRGAELLVVVSANNIKTGRLRVACIVSPKNGSGKVNAESPLASEYTINGDYPGQEQYVLLGDGEECASITFFVPFGVMDFMGDYSPQQMKADIYVYLDGENRPITEDHLEYDELSPHTITVGGKTSDYNISVEYDGGLLSPQVAVCSGNGVIYSDLPSWIRHDEQGLHILENTTKEPRFATVHVSSTGGGNVVNINVTQSMRDENLRATAKINNVWTEVIEGSTPNNKQLKIHVDCEINEARGKEIRVYVYFYCADGTTLLKKASGDYVTSFNKAISNHISTHFSNFPVSILFNSFTNAPNNPGNEAKYYIYVSEDNGQSWLAESGPYSITW